MKAMILAAGKGTRLGKITETTPKALVVINGKSILQLAVEKCTEAGFGEIIVNVHHLAGMVVEEIERLNNKGFNIAVSDEREVLLETGGGLYKARHFFDTEPFLVFNADIVTNLDLKSLLGHHLERRGLATLAVRSRPGNRFFLAGDDGLLHGWCNRSTGERIITREPSGELSEIAFSGIHIIDPGIFQYMEEGIYTMTSLYLKLAPDYKIFTFRHDEGYWFDTGTPENLEQIRKHFKE